MRRFQPADAARLRFVREAGLLRDGSCFYTASEIVDGEEVTTLWVDSEPVLSELRDVTAPAAAPDRERIAFISSGQLCVTALDGVTALTDLPQGVSGPLAWSPDARTIAFTARPAPPRDPAAPFWVTRATYRFEGLGWLDDAVREVHVVDVETRAVRRLTADEAVLTSPRWSPDGRELLFLVSFRPDVEWAFLPELHAADVASGVRRVIVGEDWGGVLAAEWIPDGERVVLLGAPPASGFFHAQNLHLWTVAAAGGEPACHTRALRAGVGTRVQADLPLWDLLGEPRIVPAGDAVYVSAQAGLDVGIYRIGLDSGAIEPIITEPGVHLVLDIDDDGRLLHLSSTFREPPDLYVT